MMTSYGTDTLGFLKMTRDDNSNSTKTQLGLKTRIGWRKKAGDRMKDLNIVRETTLPNLPPWIRLNQLKLDKVPLDRPKSEYQNR